MLKSFLYFLRLIIIQKHLIFHLAKREVSLKYIGSFLGFIWTFINPLVMIFIFWVVFSVGFKTKPIQEVPFVVWLTAGMSAWFLFAEIVNGSAEAITANSHLIKKTQFHSQILPVVKIFASLVTHFVFLFILFAFIVVQKLPFSFYYLQFFYYLSCIMVLALGIGFLVSALNPFVRDTAPIVAVLIQTGFWATPIFWSIGIMPEKLQNIFKLNPMYYVVQGYRESFLYFIPFWQHPYETAYFWLIASIIFIIGALVFKKLKPHFPDVM
jgi:lipopolysaccharide transport system permease protein/teichoic acid transport system permease protein